MLKRLRERIVVGIVGGSDLPKQREQMGESITDEVDYSFSENGLVAYKQGELIGKEVRCASIMRVRGAGRLTVCVLAACDVNDVRVGASGMHVCDSQLTSVFIYTAQSISKFLGQDNINQIVNFVLLYIAELNIPIKRYGIWFIAVCLPFLSLLH